MHSVRKTAGTRSWMLATLVYGLAASSGQAFYDGFETYTNGMTFVVATNGWQASTNTVRVQDQVVAEGSNAVVMPWDSILTNTVSPDLGAARLVWTDYRILPPLGPPPDAGTAIDDSDSARLYFDTAGYIGIDSNRAWVVCSNNVNGTPVATRISNQYVRVSLCLDYARSNAAVFLNGELLRAHIPLPGSAATNYGTVGWTIEYSTGYVDSVSIATNWPALATNSVTDLDSDGLLDVQEIQQYGNVTSYYLRSLHVAATNLTLGASGGGTVTPSGDVQVAPGSDVDFTATAAAGYHVADLLVNGVSAGADLSNRYTGQATYRYTNVLADDTTVTVQFATNFVVTLSTTSGGGIAPVSGLTAYPGMSLAFAITSLPAYVVSAVMTNGASVGDFAGQRNAICTLSNIWADVTLAAQFSYTGLRTVGGSGDYATFDAALAAALPDDTIQAADGTYALAAPIIVSNRVTLVGNTNAPARVTILAPDGNDRDCFQVRANGVGIMGFLMTGATNGPAGTPGALNAGIMVGNDAVSNQMATAGVLTNLASGFFACNQFSNCSHGVYVLGASNCVVTRSDFLGNETGVWASVTTDARSNWWGAATGPGPVGPGTGDAVSSKVLYMPWWVDAMQSARVIYSAAGLQAALDLAENGDAIWTTTNAPYAGDVTIARTVTFLTGFTVSGQLTFDAGVTLTAAVGCANAVVSSNVTVSLAGGSLTTDRLEIQGTNSFVVGTGGARLSADEFALNGDFTADWRWGTLVASTLDFADDFETYAAATRLSAIGLYGWSATDSGVVVTDDGAVSGTNAVLLPPLSELDNTVSTTSNRIWTDCHWLPSLGALPTNQATSDQSIRLSFSSNGWLAVDTTNGWGICSNDVMGGVAPKASNDWVRVTLFQDYVARRQAVFLNGVLLRQQVPFVGTNATAYRILGFVNTGNESNLYVDAVSVGTSLPANMTVSLDGDPAPDALEIHLHGDVFAYPRGISFTFR